MQTKKRENALIPVFVPILFLVQNHKSYNILIINRLDICFLRHTDNYQVSVANKTKVGCKTFYSNKGQETATVYLTDVELKGRTQKAFALAAYKAQNGDSGCLVFCPNNNQAVGIHVADGNNGYSAYLPCKYINMKFGTLPK